MLQKNWKIGVTLLIFLFFFMGIMELDAFARAGGGMSSGSRGSRSFSSPSQPYSAPSPSSPSTAPSQPMSPQPFQQPSMLRSLAMGVAGGFLGSMLFSGLSHGMGDGGFGGSGIGLFDIILIGGLLYILYTLIKRRKAAESTAGYSYQTGASPSAGRQTGFADSSRDQGYAEGDVQTGLRHIRQMDPLLMKQGTKISAWITSSRFRVRGLTAT
ncbi:MAG: hypothetical protein ACXWMI_04075 [Syntrophales bacterium]